MEEAHSLKCLALGMDIDHGFDRNGQFDMNRLMQGVSTKELQAFIEASKLPFIVKGVLSVDDAIKCKESNAAGIVVSHHHGIMDCAVPPIMTLPSIRKAVGSDMLIIVDGIYTGADAFKALALRADAVMAGRALLGDDFKERGASAVTATINRITTEMAGFMSHTGAKNLDSILSDVIYEKFNTRQMFIKVCE